MEESPTVSLETTIKKPKKRNVVLYLIFALTLFIGFKHFFPSHIHTNPKYNFRFKVPEGSTLQSKGNVFTCGRNNCAEFFGSPSFGYSTWNDIGANDLFGGNIKVNIDYIDRTEAGTYGDITASGFDNYYYSYKYKDGKVYKGFSSESEDPILSSPYPFTKAEVSANENIQKLHNEFEAVPYFTNKYGLSFYEAEYNGRLSYCTFKKSNENKFLIVCFYVPSSPEDTIGDQEHKSSGLGNSLRPIFETFKFN